MLTNEDYAKAFHEIKNSIAIVNSSIQLLESQHPELSDYEYWQDSIEALNYLKQMVQELSQAKLTSDFPMQQVNLNTFLKSLVLSVHSLYFNRKFQCKYNFEPDLPLIMADPLRLNQAIMNLIKNAYEAMESGGCVEITAYCRNNMIHIDITDFGGGIAPEYEKHLFTPFFTSKSNGTGLGLAITKQIIESHNGSLDFVSCSGTGCTFSILLPAADK